MGKKSGLKEELHEPGIGRGLIHFGVDLLLPGFLKPSSFVAGVGVEVQVDCRGEQCYSKKDSPGGC